MYLRKIRAKGKTYWTLVETYRTARGPRQRVVSYLGDMDKPVRLGVKAAAAEAPECVQGALFEENVEPDWQEIDTERVRVERPRAFGEWWVGLCTMQKLGLADLLEKLMPAGREEVPWWAMAVLSILCRLCQPSSELKVAEMLYEQSPLPDLLGIPVDRVNDDRLYRTLDRLLAHKEAIEKHLSDRLGSLFELSYDLLLYDVTSTFFEGQSERNPAAARGYSRDQRPDCKQVNIALVVSRCGLPLGFEVFAGNTHDSRTVQDMVGTVERRYGKAGRVWVMDRGMVSEENVAFLREGGRRYILGTPKAHLRRFERQLTEGGWSSVREGVEVKLCPSEGGEEVFILCRSADRADKERAMHLRFEERIEASLTRIAESCSKRKRTLSEVATQVGRLLEKNSRAARLFQVDYQTGEDGRAAIRWSKRPEWRDWSALSEGCYLLRSNITDWTPDALWDAYIQLTQAEAAFRIQKSDLELRPVWHQLPCRVEGHILVCFLAYVLWKTLGQLCKAGGLGDEPRRVLHELKQIRVVDVVLTTRGGRSIRRRCVTQPSRDQAILLKRLGIRLPKQLRTTPNVV
jgi:transposase